MLFQEHFEKAARYGKSAILLEITDENHPMVQQIFQQAAELGFKAKFFIGVDNRRIIRYKNIDTLSDGEKRIGTVVIGIAEPQRPDPVQIAKFFF